MCSAFSRVSSAKSAYVFFCTGVREEVSILSIAMTMALPPLAASLPLSPARPFFIRRYPLTMSLMEGAVLAGGVGGIGVGGLGSIRGGLLVRGGIMSMFAGGELFCSNEQT